MKEKLSALVDAELPEHERDAVLRELSRSGELRKTWERYHIARAAMRNELEILMTANFADRIAAELRGEPTPSARFRVPRGLRHAALRGTAGIALAASVAALVIGGLQYFTLPASQGYDRLAQEQVATNTIGLRSTQDKRESTDNDLNAFLMEHNEFMPSPGVNGVMSYVRLAAYNNR